MSGEDFESADRNLESEGTDKQTTQKLPCTRYFLRQNGLVTLASKFRELPVTLFTPTIALFHALIEDVCVLHRELAMDQDCILGITAFLQSMMNFSIDDDELDGEKQFCELLFSMASLMKIHTGLLVDWFSVIERVGGAPSYSGHVKPVIDGRVRTIEEQVRENGYHREFPLFSLLLNYVHHGEKVGEYSRTGLLYLIEVSSEDEALVKWVLKSDLGSLMASGLCALYSQLNRSAFSSQDTLMVAADAKTDLHVFLSYILFWQDMLVFARKSSSLTKNLVYHFDMLFVRQLLYPSIVEHTDKYGGYSDFLLSVLARILENLDHNPLSQAIICYFIGKPVLHERYESSTNLGIPSVSLFNSKEGAPLLTLNDIMCSSLGAPNSGKRSHALQLFCVMIEKYHPYLLGTLVATRKTVTNTRQEGLKNLTLVQNVCVAALEGRLDDQAIQAKINTYKRDIELIAEQTCFPPSAIRKRLNAEELERAERANRLLNLNFPQGYLRLHALQELNSGTIEESSFMSLTLFKLVPKFWINSTNENLVLTQVITTLGICGWLSLLGWATVTLLKLVHDLSQKYSFLHKQIEEYDRIMEAFKDDIGFANQETSKETATEDTMDRLPSRSVLEEPVSSASPGWTASPRSLSQMWKFPSVRSMRSLIFSSDVESDAEPDVSVQRVASEGDGLTNAHEGSASITSESEIASDTADLRTRLETEFVQVDGEHVQLKDFCMNALIFEDFLCELQALYHVKFWLFENQ